MKKTKLIIGAFLLVFCFAACGGRTTPSSLTLKCIDYLKNGDYAAYVATFNASDEEKQQLQTLLEKKGKSSIDELGGIKSGRIISEEISEDGFKAIVRAEIKYGNGRSDESVFYYQKVDEEWKQEFNK